MNANDLGKRQEELLAELAAISVMKRERFRISGSSGQEGASLHTYGSLGSRRIRRKVCGLACK